MFGLFCSQSTTALLSKLSFSAHSYKELHTVLYSEYFMLPSSQNIVSLLGISDEHIYTVPLR